MKVIIDIDERAYKACKELKTNDDSGLLGAHLINATADGIIYTGITKENMRALTIDLIDNVIQNKNYVFDLGAEYNIDLLEIIASLHNILHKEVTGDYYDYMFHWYNKIAGGSLEDGLYKKYMEGEHDTRS